MYFKIIIIKINLHIVLSLLVPTSILHKQPKMQCLTQEVKSWLCLFKWPLHPTIMLLESQNMLLFIQTKIIFEIIKNGFIHYTVLFKGASTITPSPTKQISEGTIIRIKSLILYGLKIPLSPLISLADVALLQVFFVSRFSTRCISMKAKQHILIFIFCWPYLTHNGP